MPVRGAGVERSHDRRLLAPADQAGGDRRRREGERRRRHRQGDHCCLRPSSSARRRLQGTDRARPGARSAPSAARIASATSPGLRWGSRCPAPRRSSAAPRRSAGPARGPPAPGRHRSPVRARIVVGAVIWAGRPRGPAGSRPHQGALLADVGPPGRRAQHGRPGAAQVVVLNRGTGDPPAQRRHQRQPQAAQRRGAGLFAGQRRGQPADRSGTGRPRWPPGRPAPGR